MAKIGEFVLTYTGHSGFIEKIYNVTGRGEYCHIREADGRIYYCSTSNLLIGGKEVLKNDKR